MAQAKSMASVMGEILGYACPLECSADSLIDR